MMRCRGGIFLPPRPGVNMSRKGPSTGGKNGSPRGVRSRVSSFRRSRTILLLLVFLLTLAPPASRAAGDEDARSLLRQCLKTQERTNQISMHVLSETTLDTVRGEWQQVRNEHDFHRDGDLLDVTGGLAFPGTLQVQSHRFRTVVNRDYALSWQYRPSHAKGPSAAVSYDGPVYTPDGPNFLFRLYTTTPEMGLALDGYVPQADWRRITEHLLASADVRTRGEETLGGTPCKVVTGSTTYGTVALWIAPGQGCVVRKMVYCKSAEDRPQPGEPLYLYLEGGTRQAWSFVVDVAEVEKIGDTYVPVRGHVQEVYDVSNDTRRVYDIEITRTRIALGPPDRGGGLFTMTDLPEGSPISCHHRDGVVYQYNRRGGKFAPLDYNPSFPPEIPPDSAADHVAPDRGPAGVAVRALAHVALIGLACVLFYRYRVRRRPARRSPQGAAGGKSV
jgi:hypothetical protein